MTDLDPETRRATQWLVNEIERLKTENATEVESSQRSLTALTTMYQFTINKLAAEIEHLEQQRGHVLAIIAGSCGNSQDCPCIGKISEIYAGKGEGQA